MIILTELAVIMIFGAGFYSEYLSNAYFQTYVNSLAPVLIPVLSVAFGVSSATVATFLYFGMRRVSHIQESDMESAPRRKLQTRRTPRRTQVVSEPKPAKDMGESSTRVPRPRFIITNPAYPKEEVETNSGKEESK